MDIGYGTGYTACLWAKEYYVGVVAAYISPKVLELVKERAIEKGVKDKITTIKADANDLFFPAKDFDIAISESVLVHFGSRERVF